MARITSLMRGVLAGGLALGLLLSGTGSFQSSDVAWARGSSGGRIGGGSFRSAPRSYAPAPRYAPGGGYGGGYYSPGPVVPVPVPIPFGGGYGYGYGYGGGFGLSSIFVIVIVVGAGLFFLRFIRRNAAGVGDYGGYDGEPIDSGKIDVFRLQVALLATAKQLQRDLIRLAEQSDTSTPEGLTRLNQEVTLALLRNPEYWVYAKSDAQELPRLQAESQFNRLALAERTKYTDEVVSKTGSTGLVQKKFDGENPDEVAEYIVVTLLVATEDGAPRLLNVRSSDDLRQALTILGSLSSEQIVAVEVVWSPADENDTLTSDGLLTQYTDLVRL